MGKGNQKTNRVGSGREFHGLAEMLRTNSDTASVGAVTYFVARVDSVAVHYSEVDTRPCARVSPLNDPDAYVLARSVFDALRAIEHLYSRGWCFQVKRGKVGPRISLVSENMRVDVTEHHMVVAEAYEYVVRSCSGRSLGELFAAWFASAFLSGPMVWKPSELYSTLLYFGRMVLEPYLPYLVMRKAPDPCSYPRLVDVDQLVKDNQRTKLAAYSDEYIKKGGYGHDVR